MTSSDFVKALACLTAWREEESNGLNGMLGVLFCLNNRAKLGPEFGFSHDWAVNIEKHNQFSSMSVLGDGRTIAYPDVKNPDFQRLLILVDQIFSGEAVDKLTGGGVFYADMNSHGFAKEGWFAKTILADQEKHPRTAQIGTTTYFGVKR